jgi:hypothetical protein
MKKVIAASVRKSLATNPIDRLKAMKKEESWLPLKVDMPKPTVIHSIADSSMLGLHLSASPCDTTFEIKIDDTNDFQMVYL